MVAEITHEARNEAIENIHRLADTIGVRVVLLSPLHDAQTRVSHIWRESIALRSSLIASREPDLVAAAELLIATCSSLLSALDEKLAPGDVLEMEESADL